MDTFKNYSAEQKRELGKAYFFDNNGDRVLKNKGIDLILEAYNEKDPEATYIVARLLLDGYLRTNIDNNDNKRALTLMCRSANSGFVQARAFLNAYCEDRYQKQISSCETDGKQYDSLVDFDGKPIKIDRQGVLTPIDAVLEREDGRNILTLSTNIKFVYSDLIRTPILFENAVYDGLLAWQGDYVVFGGQQLTVRVKITNDDKLFDNLVVLTVSDDFGETIKSVSDFIGTNENKRLSDMIDDKRSFAVYGSKWTANSRKIIYLQSKDGKFDDYEEIMHVAKHEFGHALGLGDLYASKSDSLAGVEKGTYIELDGYAINDKFYNLVMCDHHGPISNNDIEMVVLAFRDNQKQLFQPEKIKGKISYALGKGN